MEKIKNLWFDGNRIYMRSTENRVLSRPLEAYPELEEATAEQRNNYLLVDVSEVARAIGINKSLLARYIYGISKPSEQRISQIREALHLFAKELQTV